MDNGCACCTVRGDLVRALTQLKERKDSFDLVLLETTGLADPAPILATYAELDHQQQLPDRRRALPGRLQAHRRPHQRGETQPRHSLDTA